MIVRNFEAPQRKLEFECVLPQLVIKVLYFNWLYPSHSNFIPKFWYTCCVQLFTPLLIGGLIIYEAQVRLLLKKELSINSPPIHPPIFFTATWITDLHSWLLYLHMKLAICNEQIAVIKSVCVARPVIWDVICPANSVFSRNVLYNVIAWCLPT